MEKLDICKLVYAVRIQSSAKFYNEKRTQQSNKKLLFQFNGIEFRYFCRQMTSNLEGETLPVDPDGNLTYTNLQPIPSTAWRPNGTQGGCFGLGPGENISV